MLNGKKRAYFKKRLSQRLTNLLSDAEKPIRDITLSLEDYQDFTDQASLESDLGLTLHLKERESNLIDKIKGALERIDNGTFGVCEGCGEDISEKRLKARPMTTLCINCKRKEEADEKMRGM